MADKNSKVAITAAAVTVGVAAATYWWPKRNQSHRFHVEVPPVKLPWAMKAMTAVLPNATRRGMILQQAKPTMPLDGIDVGLKDYNPYTELGREIVPKKLWRVRYRAIQSQEFIAAVKSFFGIDLDDPAMLTKVPDTNLRQNMEQAMKNRAAMTAKNKGLPKEEQMRNLAQGRFEDSQDMLVVRVNNDSLLLYNPCRMHPPVLEWLNKLGGTVEWIVSGSSSHTNQMPQAAEAFPNAKILCSQAANEKCQSVGMRSADYIYTDPAGLKNASQTLTDASNGQLRLFYLKGDTLTQNLCVIAHNHLLEVDLVCYGDGKKMLMADKNDWEQPSEDNPNYQWLLSGQLFYGMATLQSVQAGYLPDFRLLAMNPASLLSKWMALDEPNPDGSSCKEFAKSLRTLLSATDYSFVDSAHSLRQKSIPADEVKQAVNGMWSWLDGNTIL